MKRGQLLPTLKTLVKWSKLTTASYNPSILSLPNPLSPNKVLNWYSLVVSQYYVTEAENEYVIRGNAAIVRCKIPSFVSDFVYVESWLMDDGQILTINNTSTSEGI